MASKSLSNPSRRRWLWRLAFLAVFLAAILAGAAFWLARRGGEEFYGRPESLLPPGAALTASCRDLSGLLRQFESLNAVLALRQDEDLAALLLGSAAWRKLEREKDKTRYILLRRMARDFIDTWFGREVTLAVLPPSACAVQPAPTVQPAPAAQPPSASSGLLVIARTDIGFEENLAELVAHYYPELALEKREYRGHALYRYNAEKTRRAFAYCRFGKTLVVSLRSPEWNWLEAVVDRRIGRDTAGNPPPTLANEPRLREAADWSHTARGVSVCVDPRTLAESARCFPGKSFGSASWTFWIDYLDEALRGAQWGALRMRLDDDGLRLVSLWKAAPAPHRLSPSDPSTPSASSSPSRALRRLRRFPKDTPFALSVESRGLNAFANGLMGRMTRTRKYAKRIASFEKVWREWTGSDLARDWIEPMGDSLGVGLTSLAGGPLFPIPTVQAWWEGARPDDAKRLADLLTTRGVETGQSAGAAPPSLDLPVGRLGFAADESAIVFDLNRDLAPPPANEDSRENGSGLASRPLLADVWQNDTGAIPTLCLFADFESGYRCLEQVHSAAMLWSKKARKNLASWETLLAAARHLRALRLTATPDPDGVRVEAVVFVD